MDDAGHIRDRETGEELTRAQSDALRENVRAQCAHPERRGKDHIRLSTIWETTQNIRKIKAQLASGYTFDKAKMTEMVEAMFAFINAVVDPNVNPEDQGADVKVEEVTK